MSGEVKPGYLCPQGYKLTEVGVIPEEWETLPCSELSERIMVGIVIRPTQYYVPQGIHAGCNCIDILITRPSKKVDSDYLAIWVNSSFGKEISVPGIHPDIAERRRQIHIEEDTGVVA